MLPGPGRWRMPGRRCAALAEQLPAKCARPASLSQHRQSWAGQSQDAARLYTTRSLARTAMVPPTQQQGMAAVCKPPYAARSFQILLVGIEPAVVPHLARGKLQAGGVQSGMRVKRRRAACMA